MGRVTLVEKLVVNIFTPYDYLKRRQREACDNKLGRIWKTKSVIYGIILDLRWENNGTITKSQSGYFNSLCGRVAIATSYFGYHIRRIFGEKEDWSIPIKKIQRLFDR